MSGRRERRGGRGMKRLGGRLNTGRGVERTMVGEGERRGEREHEIEDKEEMMSWKETDAEEEEGTQLGRRSVKG